MLDNASMTIAPRCHQHPVRHLRAIIRGSRPPRARSCYHSLPARSNWRRQGPSRGFGRRQRPRQAAPRRPGTAAAPAIRSADAAKSRPAARLQPLDQRFWPGDARKIELGARRRVNRHIVEVAPCPRAAKKNSSLAGANTAASTGGSILDQRHADAPVFAAGEIAAGAVDRIDNPDQALAEPRFVVDAFFRQPAIVRRRRSQPCSPAGR